MDTLKRRVMLDGTVGFGSTAKGRGTIGYAAHMLRTEGLGAFYRGCLVNAFKSAPAASLTFVLNDTLRDAFFGL